MKKNMVSIITPVYNAEQFLEDTIKSVINQTYTNWELLLINDCSSDSSEKIASKYLNNKIKWINMEKNGGAALARNKGIELAGGEFICFLDADDIWELQKLEKQINFMKKKNCEFSFTGYEFADKAGKATGKKVFIPEKLNYNEALKNTVIWTCTVMFDMKKLNKEDIFMPNVASEDTACWWKVLKKIDFAYGLNEILSYYRRSGETLSSNKFVAIKRIWYLYRKVEHLNIFKASSCFLFYAIRAVLRRI